MSAPEDDPPEAQEPPRAENGDSGGPAAGKRKAEAESPLETELPPPKRNNSCSVAAEEHEPPPPGRSTEGAEPEGERAAPGGEEPAPEAHPPAHDPAYAAAAFPEPVGLPEFQAAPAVTGTVGYSMPAYDGVSQQYAFPVDHLLVGRIIGKGGDTIRQIQFASGAHIDINQQVPEGAPRTVCELQGTEVDPLGKAPPPRRPPLSRRSLTTRRVADPGTAPAWYTPSTQVSLSGPPGAIQACRSLLDDLLRTPVASTPGALVVPPGGMERTVLCSRQYVGRIIGRQGDIIKGLQAITGARIQIDQTTDPCRVSITGSQEAAESCAAIVGDIANGGHTAQYSYAAYVSRTAAGAWAQSGGAPATGAYGSAAGGDPSTAGYGMDPYAAAGAYAAYGAYPGYQAPGYWPAAGTPGAGAAGGGAGEAAQEWVVGDDGKGNTYYYNSRTGVSQWTAPPGFSA